jgi:hypothetical protein
MRLSGKMSLLVEMFLDLKLDFLRENGNKGFYLQRPSSLLYLVLLELTANPLNGSVKRNLAAIPIRVFELLKLLLF